MDFYKKALTLIVIFSLTACTVSTKDSMVINPPVGKVKDKIESMMGDKKEPEKAVDEFPKIFAILPLVNMTEEKEASDVMRRVLQGHLSTKNYQFVHWKTVSDKLSESNLAAHEHLKNIPATMSTLGVDGAISGTIKDYELFYAGVYAKIKITVELNMHNLKGEQLWSQTFDATSSAGGVSLTLWGNLINAASAAMHLDNENLLAVADEVGRKAYAAFPEPPGFSSSTGPEIQGVLHDGANKVLRYGDTLKVGIKGAPGNKGDVVIEGVGVVALDEREAGVYVADIPVSKRWNGTDVMLRGRLTNEQGVFRQFVSTAGLLTFDNIAPAVPKNVNISAAGGIVNASWSGISDAELYRLYHQSAGGQWSLVKEINSTSTSFSKQLAFFNQENFAITSIDAAGNESEKSRVSTTVLPVADMANYKVLKTLSGSLSGQLRLTSSHSPYYVAEAVTFDVDSSLVIEPGTQIQFGKKGKLVIRGNAQSWSHENSVILVPAKSNVNPDTMVEIDTKGTVSLAGLSVRGAGIAVDVKQGKPLISDSKFLNNVYSAFNLMGTSSTQLSNVTISGSNTSGIVVSERAKLMIKNSQFENNQPFHIQSSSIYPISAQGNQWQPAASASTILGEVSY